MELSSSSVRDKDQQACHVRMPPFVPRKRHRSPSPPPQAPSPKRAATVRTRRAKPSLFDTLDASTPKARTPEDNKAFLDAQEDSESESSLSDADSDELEGVLNGEARPTKGQKAGESTATKSATATDTEEDVDWEDAIPDPTHARPASGSHAYPHAPEPSGDLEITLTAPGARINYSDNLTATGRKGPSKIERQIRIQTHCMHVQYLLFHNTIRNAWTCDKEVQKILTDGLSEGMKAEVVRWKRAMGMAPPPEPAQAVPKSKGKPKGKDKQKSAEKAAKNRIRDWGAEASRLEPNAPNLSRGDPLLRLLKYLSSYWKKKFRITAPGLRKQGHHTLTDLEERVKSFHNDPHNPERHGERIKNVEAFREAAKRCEGSRDVGAQLFTALLRGLGLEARLVASLQPAGFGWSKAEDARVKKARKKGVDEKDFAADNGSSSSESEDEVSEDEAPVVAKKPPAAAKSNKPAPKRPTRGGKDKPIDVDDNDNSDSELSTAPGTDSDASIVDMTPAKSIKASSKLYDKDLLFPTYWSEVISPVTNTHTPVSPFIVSSVAHTPDLRAAFEPRGKKADKTKQVIAYVIAYSSDGSAKDVTVRYLKRRTWPGRTKGFRLPAEKVPVYNKRGKVKRYEQYDWFKTVMSGYARPASKRTLADELEDTTDLVPVQPASKAKAAGAEETLQGYKNSADFVLERHLRREEAILPSAQPVKHFRTGKGDNAKAEPVYRRRDVVPCKTVESWHKEGRQVKAGEQPLKYVPIRAVTLVRKREVEEAARESGAKPQQGLYARHQTEWIVPEPIKDGKIPRNAFGNIDVYVPTMVPRGAVHIPLRATVRVCKRLGIDFAEACTGFEFGKQRAVPVLTGVVVAAENENLVIDAWEEEEAARKRKEDAKREKIALGMWRKFLMGLRIVERVRLEYGTEHEGRVLDQVDPFPGRRTARNNEKGHLEDGRGKNCCEPDRDDAPGHDEMDVGGGGFFPPGHDEEEVTAGRFIRDGESDAEAGGGGFLLDHDNHSPPPKLKSSLVANCYPYTPISLQAAHQKPVNEDIQPSSADEEEGDDDDDDGEEHSEPIAKARQAPTAARGRSRGRGRAGPAGSGRTAAASRPTKASRAAANGAARRKRKKGTDAGDSTASVGADPSETDGASDCEEESVAPFSNAARAVPRRQAARKSESAVRSHYFDHASGDEDAETDGSGAAPAKRRDGSRLRARAK